MEFSSNMEAARGLKTLHSLRLSFALCCFQIRQARRLSSPCIERYTTIYSGECRTYVTPPRPLYTSPRSSLTSPAPTDPASPQPSTRSCMLTCQALAPAPLFVSVSSQQLQNPGSTGPVRTRGPLWSFN
ncbi:unnamed protein product [Arctogadus glacialis]